MKHSYVFPFFLSFLLAAISTFSQSISPQSMLEGAVAKNEMVGIAAGVLHQNTIQTYSAGSKDAKMETPFTEETVTRIASIAKPITAVAIMQLVEQGKLNLTDTISRFFPQLSTASHQQITVQQLLQHCAGISGYKTKKEQENQRHYSNLKEIGDIILAKPLDFAPGSKFGYTSYGYVILGRLIEEISGLSYEAYVQQHIFSVAGMHHSAIENALEVNPAQSAMFHKNNKEKIGLVKKPTDLSDRIPGGGIVSTAKDMMLFAKALLNGKLISEKSFLQLQQNSELKKRGNPYAMGWYLYGDNPKLGNVIGHTGGQTGASAILYLAPKHSVAVIVVSNTSGAMFQVTSYATVLLNSVELN